MDLHVEQAFARLKGLPPEEALAIFEALESKRRRTQFIKYWEPTPDQGEALRAITAAKKTIIVRGGNRSGKTVLGAFVAVAFGLGRGYFRDEPAWELVEPLPIPEPPNNIWIVGLDYSVLRDIIWREKLISGQNQPPFVPDDESVKNVREVDYQIFFENGSVITCKSAESGREKFQSASCDLIWIDEEPEAEIYNECYQRTVDCAGKILVTVTPLIDVASGIREPWIYDLYEKHKAGVSDIGFASLSVMNNPHVPEGEKVKLKEKWAGHPEEKARLYGDFVQRSGLVYNTWDPARHLVKPFRIPSEWQRLACIDPAPTGPTAVLWCAVHPNRDLYFYREYLRADAVISEHTKGIKIRGTGDPIDLWLMDPKGGGQRNAENHKTICDIYRENGIPARLAELDPDYGLQESMEYMNATVTPNARHPKAYFFSDLYEFRREVEKYCWAFFGRGEKKGLSKEKPLKRGDHLQNCYQYLCAQRPRGKRQASESSAEDKQKQAQLNSYT